jgi:hypothetical protein
MVERLVRILLDPYISYEENEELQIQLQAERVTLRVSSKPFLVILDKVGHIEIRLECRCLQKYFLI